MAIINQKRVSNEVKLPEGEYSTDEAAHYNGFGLIRPAITRQDVLSKQGTLLGDNCRRFTL